MTATEVFESVTNGGSSDFAQVVTILNASGPWCLIDGLAVNCYAELVYTVDADVVVVSENLPAIREELSRAGFSVNAFAHSLNARKGSSKLSVQFTSDERYQSFIGRAQHCDVLGHKVPVATIEDIIQGKNLGVAGRGSTTKQAEKGRVGSAPNRGSTSAAARTTPG